MLKDAADLQLRLLLEALAEDLILKDATSYNVQWSGSQPVFIDVASFEPYRRGEPWSGYRPVLQTLSLPPSSSGPQEPFLPWLAPWQSRGH